jgi:hypothetical protein
MIALYFLGLFLVLRAFFVFRQRKKYWSQDDRTYKDWTCPHCSDFIREHPELIPTTAHMLPKGGGERVSAQWCEGDPLEK